MSADKNPLNIPGYVQECQSEMAKKFIKDNPGYGFVFKIPPDHEVKAKVIDIEENMPHKASEVICVKCGQRWLAVRPSVTKLKDLECSVCGRGFVIETGEGME